MVFLRRHIGNYNKEILLKMLNVCGVNSLDKLVEKTNIYQNFDKNNTYISNISEINAHKRLKSMMDKNIKNTSFIGLGYYNNYTPSPIKRHILENAQWYTSYTPYQAEISQGRLESQYNFQTVIKELTGMPIANASLLDEASAAGEALNLSNAFYRGKRDALIVADDLHPQTLDVLETRSKILNLKMETLDIENINNLDIDYDRLCNFIFQYPNTYGNIKIDLSLIKKFKENNVLTTGITDLLSLTKLITPGEIGLDITLGSSQRFGIPLWYGGPHPAFFAVSKKLLRYVPGRIIGKSIDSSGDDVYRIALQTREQHIRRQNATSNICTSQSLLTNVVGFYALHHGKKGITNISKKINRKTKYFFNSIGNLDIVNDNFYDTITFKINSSKLQKEVDKHNILIRIIDEGTVSVSFDETIDNKKIDILVKCIKKILKINKTQNDYKDFRVEEKYRRKTDFFNQDIFTKYHSETELLRYINSLALKDYTLCNGMIPLGSCTMKLNATYQLEPLTWDSVANMHPFSPKKYVEGYNNLILKTGDYLKKLTGFNNVSFQSNSGATGEYAGLLCIKKYHEKNKTKRDMCIIPNTAHGTNFASASISNMKIDTFDENYFDDMEKFENYVKNFKDNLACLMITYPGTNGVFQKNIDKIVEIVHDNGGLVYLDGANMNALVGLFNPADIGIDVCHLNLHKTFCIPHGGGGPGLGPILCNDKLSSFLPGNRIQGYGSIDTCGYISSSNFSSASLLTIPYLYISCMGTLGLSKATKIAILNSNYLKNSLKDDYTIKDVNENGVVGHEFIIDVSEFKKLNINENDIAKRLMDYNFHPPTMSWPRSGVLMFEPTESETIEELDRLILAMKSIREEIREIEKNKNFTNNLLKNAPHSFKTIDKWKYDYTIQEAFYPVKNLYNKKFNIPVSRVDDVYGDKLLMNINR